MITDQYGQIALNEDDIMDLIMQGRDVVAMDRVLVDRSVDLEKLIHVLEDPGQLVTWTFVTGSDIAVPAWDDIQQSNWHMPEEYKQLDIAEHVLSLCSTQEQLQRAGQELLLYQERGLFSLLKYLKYLVDVMEANRVIWGVGRGSSVASYVLYKLGVHRIDSLFYDLDPHEFLR